MTYDETLDSAVAASRSGPEVTFGKAGKLVLPDTPALDDFLGQCTWLTVVFNLDPAHPVKGAAHQGRRGPEGHIVVMRVDAPEIAFEPATVVNTPTRLIPALTWWSLPSDGPVHAFQATHCRQISYVLRMLCGVSEAMGRRQVAMSILATFTSSATPIEGATTYGTSAQRYEAAVTLRRELSSRGQPIGPPHYLIDANTGEIVVAVSDLQEAARRHEGGSLPNGWLDARMEALEWERIELDGHATPGRAGRQGLHRRIYAYRGHWITIPDDAPDEEGVTT